MPGDQTSTLDSCVVCSNSDEWKPICVLTDHNYSLPIVKPESVCGHSVSHNVGYCALDTGVNCNVHWRFSFLVLFPSFCRGSPGFFPRRMKVRQYLLVTQNCCHGTLYIWGQHSFDTSSWLHFIFTGETPVKLEVNMIEAPSASTALVCLLTPSP